MEGPYYPRITHQISGNTAGATANISSGTFVLAGGNNITLSQNGNAVTIAGGAGGAGDGGNIIAAGGSTAASTGTIVFSNSNGVSFGLNGNTVTATVQTNYLTTAALSNHSHAFATTTTNGASIIVGTTNSNGVTIGVPPYLTTAQPVGAYLTTARASNDAVGLNTAATNVTWTVNSSGISLNGSGYAGTGTSATNASVTLNSAGLAISVAAPGGGGAINVSAGTTSGNLQTLQFNNSNGVTFGLNGSTITASVGAAGGGATLSSYYEGLNNLTLLSAGINAGISVVRFVAPVNITATQVAFPLYQSISSSATANTYGQQWSVGVGVYTNDTVNNRLMSLSLGNTNTTFTLASNNAGATQIIGSGVRPITCPININMTPGVYYMAFVFSTNTFSSGTATTALNRTASFLGRGAIMSASYALVSDYTVATGVTNNRLWPQGIITGASSSLPLTISHSQITMTGASNSAANIAFYFRA